MPDIHSLSRDVSPRDPMLDLLPPPFEWCDIPAGQVRLEANAFSVAVAPFKMAKYPITFAQFQAFVDAPDGFADPRCWQGLAANASHRSAPGDQQWKIDNHPRENVSWWDAAAFCQWLNARLGLPPVPADLTPETLAACPSLRLPTEWEWQWAAQGPDGRAFPWGSEYKSGYANIVEVARNVALGKYHGQTTPVGSYPQGASPYGVLDLSGNVLEWCLNKYRFPQKISLGGRDARVVRGGSWRNNQNHARASYLDFDNPGSRINYNGFRVVCGSPSL